MIIRAVYIGNSEEAYINKEFKEGLNIISSDDNNKGKTIVIQAIMYCLGNIPAFPSAFDYENYYFILYIEQDDKLIKICRKNKNFVIRKDEEYTVFDNTAEFKRYWNKNIQKLPIIKKENIYKIVDPELLVQIFFVGQDKKVTYDIVNKGFYKKEDFYKLIYSMAGINGDAAPIEDIEKAKKKIKELKNERDILLKENKILKKNLALEFLSSTNDRAALEGMLKEVERIKNKLVNLKKERSNAVSRRTKNEIALKELRSLNRTMKTGQISCMDCGSTHIAYESADSEFSFDISTSKMRTQILNSVQEKIDIYNEEITRLTNEISLCQKELDACMETEDIPIEALLVIRQEMEGARNADDRIKEIDTEVQELSGQLEMKSAISEDIEKKIKNLLNGIINTMNGFYSKVDSAGTEPYADIFTTRDKIYSGIEATEFHLARMYAFGKILKHDYPIIVDSFRAEDLSTERENKVLNEFKELDNQIIFTTTLKAEEGEKYAFDSSLNNISFSGHVTNKMLSNAYVDEFRKVAEEMLITINS